MDAFDILDNTSAAGRLIILLLDYENGISVVDMHKEMKNRYNVGRGSTDTSKNELQKIGLINFKKVDVGSPRRIHSYRLTKRGKIIAIKMKEIKEILENE
jgi:hypothetical protein